MLYFYLVANSEYVVFMILKKKGMMCKNMEVDVLFQDCIMWSNNVDVFYNLILKHNFFVVACMKPCLQ